MPATLINAPTPQSDWKLIIPPDIYQRLYYYVQSVPYEISGFIKANITPENSTIIATDIIILEQESSSAHTEMTQEAQAKYLNQLMKNKENPADWCIWWHSHGNLESFWSGTDNATIEAHTNQPFLVSLVTNRKQNTLARIDTWSPRVAPFSDLKLHDTEHIEVFTSFSPDPALQATIKAEVAEKVKQSVTAIVPAYQYNKTTINGKPAKYSLSGGYDDWYGDTNNRKPIGFDYDQVITEREAREIATKQDKRIFDANGYDQDGFDIYGYSFNFEYNDDKNLMS